MPAIRVWSGARDEVVDLGGGDEIEQGYIEYLVAVVLALFLVPMIFICLLRVYRRRYGHPPISRSPQMEKLRKTRAEWRLKSSTVRIPDGVDKASILARECAICLSNLYAPSLPEPVKLHGHGPPPASAKKAPSIAGSTTSGDRSIVRLKTCGHEFHNGCLVSWAACGKLSCPMCRAEITSVRRTKFANERRARERRARRNRWYPRPWW